MRISDWSSDVCSSDLGDPARRASLSGRPAVGIDLLITDADGVPLLEQREAEGHPRVRGGTVVERYFGQRKPATDAAGWFDPGDLPLIDRACTLTIHGHAKHPVNSGSRCCSPAAHEAPVDALP